MIKIENDCVGCGLPCLGSACPYREVPYFYCDDCEYEYEELAEYDIIYLRFVLDYKLDDIYKMRNYTSRKKVSTSISS